jgi:hypothetical protein
MKVEGERGMEEMEAELLGEESRFGSPSGHLGGVEAALVGLWSCKTTYTMYIYASEYGNMHHVGCFIKTLFVEYGS